MIVDDFDIIEFDIEWDVLRRYIMYKEMRVYE